MSGNRQSQNDRQAAIFDCHDRMSGYTYIGIMDHDDFVIPSGNRTLKELMVFIFTVLQNLINKTFMSGHSKYLVPSLDSGVKNRINGPYHVTNMAGMPIYDKIIKYSS